MGMVGSQLEILGNRLADLGTTTINYENKNCSEPASCNDDNNKLQLCIKEHQNILE